MASAQLRTSDCNSLPDCSPCFYPFPNLPAEIRLLIWKFAITGQHRIVEITVGQDSTPRPSDAPHQYTTRNAQNGRLLSGGQYSVSIVEQDGCDRPHLRLNSPLLYATIESRHLALGLYRVRIPCYHQASSSLGPARTKMMLYLYPERDFIRLRRTCSSYRVRFHRDHYESDGHHFVDFLNDVRALYDPKGVGITNMVMDPRQDIVSYLCSSIRADDLMKLRVRDRTRNQPSLTAPEGTLPTWAACHQERPESLLQSLASLKNVIWLAYPPTHDSESSLALRFLPTGRRVSDEQFNQEASISSPAALSFDFVGHRWPPDLPLLAWEDRANYATDPRSLRDRRFDGARREWANWRRLLSFNFAGRVGLSSSTTLRDTMSPPETRHWTTTCLNVDDDWPAGGNKAVATPVIDLWRVPTFLVPGVQHLNNRS